MSQGVVDITQVKDGISANQACTACLDACAPKVTVLQLLIAQRCALRRIQCQYLIVYDSRIQNN